MKVDTRDKKPKVYSIAVISAVAAALFAGLALHGGEHASLCICALIVAYLAAVAGILISTFFRQVQYNPYSYNTIYYAGISLFVLVLLILQLHLLSQAAYWPERFGVDDFMRDLTFSAKSYIYLTSPLIILFSLALVVSNIILVRREGRAFVNTLGALLAIVLAMGLVVLFLLDEFFFKSWTMDLAASFVAAVYLYTECMLSGAAIACLLVVRHDPPADRDFLIVLGCGLRADGTPTPLLRGRLDRAFSFWQMQHAKAGFSPILITSGGQGSDEVVPESTAMKNYLVERGVPEEQIIEEDQSTSTFENMKYSKAKIEEAWNGKNQPRIGFSTTNYHEFRSGIYARRVKMRAEGICAPTKWYFWPNAWVREFVGIVTEHRLKQSLVLGGMICFYVVMTLVVY